MHPRSAEGLCDFGVEPGGRLKPARRPDHALPDEHGTLRDVRADIIEASVAEGLYAVGFRMPDTEARRRRLQDALDTIVRRLAQTDVIRARLWPLAARPSG